MRSKHALPGFTLLELSVVLVIIGIITGMGLIAGKSLLDSAKRAATENKLSEIERALMDFRIVHNRLPCPSDYTLASSNSSYGVESVAGNVCGIATIPHADSAVEGGVPTVTLGLPDEFALDGWGNRIRYAVDMNAAVVDAFSMIKPNESCGIGVLDANFYSRTNDTNIATFTSFTDGALDDPYFGIREAITGERVPRHNIRGAVYALISHGANGHGARTAGNSVVSKGSTNPAELVNCHCNSAAADAGLSGIYVQAETVESATAANYFDDVVRFKKRYQLQAQSDANNFNRYLGPELVTIDTNNDLALYNHHCGYWRKTQISASGSAVDPTASGNAVGALFTPKNDLFVYRTSAPNCTMYPYALTTTATTQLTDGANYGTAITGVTNSSVCSANDSAAKFAMAENSGIVAVAKTASPYVEIWKYSQISHSFMYAQPSGGSFFTASTPAAIPELIKISKDGSYLLLTVSTDTRLYKKTSGDNIKYKPFTTVISEGGGGTQGDVVAAAFSPDGQHIALATADLVTIWKIAESDASGAVKLTSTIDLTDFTGINGLAYSPDGNYLAVTQDLFGSKYVDNIRIYAMAYSSTEAVLTEALGANFTDVAPAQTFDGVVTDYTLNGKNSPLNPVFTGNSRYLIAPTPLSVEVGGPITILRKVGVSGNYSFQPAHINELSADYGMLGGAQVSGTAVRDAAVSH